MSALTRRSADSRVNFAHSNHTVVGTAAVEMGARYRCRSCKAPLPNRGARCRLCGWAADYDPRTTRQERDLVLGISFIVVAIVLAIAIAVTIAYVKPRL